MKFKQISILILHIFSFTNGLDLYNQMFRNLKLFSILFFLVGNLSLSITQISVAEADSVKETLNSIDGRVINAYFFDGSKSNLQIRPTTNRQGGVNYNWFYYEPTSGWQSFSDVPNTDTTINLDTIASSKGVMLVKSNGDTSVCWVYVDNYYYAFSGFSNEKENIIDEQFLSCANDPGDFAVIRMKIGHFGNIYRYYDPITGIENRFTDNLDYEWKTDPPNMVVPSSTTKPSIAPGDAHYDTVTYILNKTTIAKREISDTIVVPSIWPKAAMDVSYIHLTNREYYDGKEDWYYEAYEDSTKVSAPAVFKLKSESFNTEELTWFLMHKVGDNPDAEKDSLLKEILAEEDSLYYTFEQPGEGYYVKLEAKRYFDKESNYCFHDTIFEIEEIDDPPKVSKDASTGDEIISIPNAVMIPDNRFRFDDYSVTDFEIAIYSRIGKKVHQYSGNIREWPGWDGTIKNTSNYVATGVYYYVIRVYRPLEVYRYGPSDNLLPTGADEEHKEKELSEKEQRGFIHVFNTQQ
ncbi:MAG: gliding motility-associated C-terminal domain-containing protein [Bacteroidales bacterium]|nr:gliding motility-associated C-terminal domain-containing protein [Bacteroidales bacterium]